MPQIKIPSTMCTTINCPKATECLRKTNVKDISSKFAFTPQINTPTNFACKGFLPIPS